MNSAVDDPLSDEEILELDELLFAASDDAMPVTVLHGFLTAVVSGPTLVRPKDWLEAALGSSDSLFADIDQARRTYGLIMRLYNETNFALTECPELFEPILPRANRKNGPTYGGFWSRGYVEGMRLSIDDWSPYFEEPEIADHVRAIINLADDLPGERLPRGIRRAEVPDILAASAVAVHAWFLKQRRRASTVRRSASKVGRNERCPCGSGKKFKACCGAA